jgi:hypothetical protein
MQQFSTLFHQYPAAGVAQALFPLRNPTERVTWSETGRARRPLHLLSSAAPALPVLWYGSLELRENGVFWDVTPCGSCKNRRFRGT